MANDTATIFWSGAVIRFWGACGDLGCDRSLQVDRGPEKTAKHGSKNLGMLLIESDTRDEGYHKAVFAVRAGHAGGSHFGMAHGVCTARQSGPTAGDCTSSSPGGMA